MNANLFVKFFESDSKLKEIGDSAFGGSGVKAIEIPSTVETMGECCFSESTCLYEIAYRKPVNVGFLECNLSNS
jgi:hypothetical protein